eukprot:COSAG05_NODE_2152_length_3472_cov_3.475245_1_plen_114_part_00
MYIETSVDARRSTQRTASGGHDGPAAGGRGYFATAASRFSTWWSGERRSPALTADAASGAGVQGGNDDEFPSSDGDANLAPLEGDSTTTPSDLVAQLSVSAAPQEGGLDPQPA